MDPKAVHIITLICGLILNPEKKLLSFTDPVSCTADGDGLRVAQPGVTATFTVYARDGSGRRRDVGGDRVTARVRGPTEVPGVVQDNGNGTYSITYTPDSLGVHIIDVLVLGCPISGSPFESIVAPSMLFHS